MWRALFLSLGIAACILGAECLVVDTFVLGAEQTTTVDTGGFGAFTAPVAQKKEIQPAEWAPWTLLSSGAVVILYSLTLNRGGP